MTRHLEFWTKCALDDVYVGIYDVESFSGGSETAPSFSDIGAHQDFSKVQILHAWTITKRTMEITIKIC